MNVSFATERFEYILAIALRGKLSSISERSTEFFKNSFALLRDAVGKSSVFALLGCGAKVLSAPLAPPLLYLAGSLLISRVLFKVGENLKVASIKTLKRKVCEAILPLKSWQMVAAVFFATLSFLFQPLAILAGVVYGALSAVTSDTFQAMQALNQTTPF